MSIIKKLEYLAKRLITGGVKELRDYEFQVISLFFSSLSPEDQTKIIGQFRKYDIVQRDPNGRVVQFFQVIDDKRQRWGDAVLLDGYEKPYMQINVKPSNSKLSCQLILANGALASLIFKNPPNPYNGGQMLISEVAKELSILKKNPTESSGGEVGKPQEYFG